MVQPCIFEDHKMRSIYTGEVPFNPSAFGSVDAVHVGHTRRGLRITRQSPDTPDGAKQWQGACIFCGQSLVLTEEMLTRWHSDVCGCRYSPTR